YGITLAGVISWGLIARDFRSSCLAPRQRSGEKRLAVGCGAAGEVLTDAVRVRADVVLTGEMRLHDYLPAKGQGGGLVLPGHSATERLGVEELAVQLQQRWPELEVWVSRVESDPVVWWRGPTCLAREPRSCHGLVLRCLTWAATLARQGLPPTEVRHSRKK